MFSVLIYFINVIYYCNVNAEFSAGTYVLICCFNKYFLSMLKTVVLNICGLIFFYFNFFQDSLIRNVKRTAFMWNNK